MGHPSPAVRSPRRNKYAEPGRRFENMRHPACPTAPSAPRTGRSPFAPALPTAARPPRAANRATGWPLRISNPLRCSWRANLPAEEIIQIPTGKLLGTDAGSPAGGEIARLVTDQQAALAVDGPILDKVEQHARLRLPPRV